MASDSSQSRWLRSNFMAVQSAFLFFRLLPPPAPGARVLALDHGPRAGRAADRAVALVVQRVVGHVIAPDVVPDLVLAPAGERIEFLQAVRGIPFLDLDRGAQPGLAAAHAGDPGALAGERPCERLDLAKMAALLAQFG